MSLGALTDPDGYAWLLGGEGWAGNGVRDRLAPSGPDRFAVAAAWAAEVLGPDERAFASFTFTDPSRVGTSTVTPRVPTQGGDPAAGRTGGVEPVGSALVVPESLHRISQGDARPPSLGRVDSRIRYAGSTVDEVRWMEAVAEATSRIHTGAYDKVVLARDLHVWAEHELDPIGLTARLAERFPSCMTFLHERFVGATPELLLRRTGRQVTSVVLAGTAPPDPASGRALLDSAKDASEHAFARDSAVASLGPYCAELHVDAEPWLLHLDNVQHLATRITGVLAQDHHVLELVGAMHPTAAVGGAPHEAAVADIRPLEGMDRDRYAGPVGMLDADGDGVFGIALRCAQLRGNRARLFAGCGIVADSLPDEELEETRLKLLAMQSVLAA